MNSEKEVPFEDCVEVLSPNVETWCAWSECRDTSETTDDMELIRDLWDQHKMLLDVRGF